MADDLRDASKELEHWLNESARLRTLALCGQSIDTAASVMVRYRVEVALERVVAMLNRPDDESP